MLPSGLGPLAGSYQLISQLGASPDGVAYRARIADTEGSEAGDLVEVRTLAGLRADPLRWARWTKRLRLCQLLQHPGAIRVRDLRLDSDPPFVVLDLVEGPCLADRSPPLPLADALILAGELTDTLLAAHRLGLSLSPISLDPARIPFTPAPSRRPLLDFTLPRCREPSPSPLEDRGSQRGEKLDLQSSMGHPTEEAALDVQQLGSLLAWMLTGQPPGGAPLEDPVLRNGNPALRALLGDLLNVDSFDRPTLRQVQERLAFLGRSLAADSLGVTRLSLSDSANEQSPSVSPDQGPLASRQLGRYRLLQKLGQGGMGEVYQAEDAADGSIVAVKVLRGFTGSAPRDSQDGPVPLMLRRFRKEARLLAEVNNPHVANLLEINEDQGVHYLVLEYVQGMSLDKLMEEDRPLAEKLALAILADVCRALVEAHRQGIVHRDIKPENILLQPIEAPQGSMPWKVKLTDFGLARHVVESESLHLTRTGAILGTPLYLSPEQCGSAYPVDARSDVYNLGATLFHLLAGRPPFLGESPLAVISQHCNEPPPALQSLNPAASEGVCSLIERTLAKNPEHRPADAAALLEEFERLLRGEPTGPAAHPRLPPCDPQRILRFDFRWELQASPRQLWPFVSNTERLNRAIGLPAVQFRIDSTGGQPRRLGRIRKMGVEAGWQEHPFEWVEGRRFGVLRECSRGPFKWLLSVVELTPRAGGGTVLQHSFRVEPNGFLGRAVAGLEIGLRGRRGLDRVYRRIDATLANRATPGLTDPFEEPGNLGGGQRHRLERILDRLVQRGLDAEVVEQLGEYLSQAASQELARIRPLALARQLGVDADALLAACLHAAREGLLVLLWDLLCPICRIPSEVKDTLRAVRDHGRCEACQIDYELDLSSAVEMIFRVHPSIREAELGTYCIGGPAHSPHVAAQVRVRAGERLELPLELEAGAYRLRGPQLPAALDFSIEAGGPLGRAEIDLARLTEQRQEGPIRLRAGGQSLQLFNGLDREVVVRLERATVREDALTAGRASALALFRELFPGEVLSRGQLVSISTVTLLWTDLSGTAALARERGEAEAFARLHAHLRDLEEVARRQGGALVKSIGEGALAAFAEPLRALQAALALPRPPAEVRLRAALHHGPALATTLNDHLDYFGNTIRQGEALLRQARPGELLVSQEILEDPDAAGWLLRQEREVRLERLDLPGRPGAIVHRVEGLW